MPTVLGQSPAMVLAALVLFGISGVMLLVMNRSLTTTAVKRPAARRPGWVARRRARGGIRPTKAGAAIGYASATRQVGLSPRELGLGGLILGAPGSGKTWAAAVLVEAQAWQGTACVILDPKPSRDLAEVVAGADGIIWTLGGELAWDALPSDPSELANQLVEVLPVDARTKVYRDAARLWVLVAGQALQRQREHPTVARMAALCRPGGLAGLLKSQGRLGDLPRLSQTEQDGVLSMGTSLSILARGVAGRSLGAGASALRLEDAIGRGQLVLLQMAAGPYPEETRMLGAWALRAMLRLLRHPAPCVLVCDEFARLGVQGRAALDLLALGREFKKPVILCTQGPSDFGELGAHALDQAAQDAAWVLAFRQGTRDSTTASRLLGVRWAEERSWSTGRDTRENVRIVEQPYVSASALEDLEPGTAHLRVPSVDGRPTRVEHVRVATPSLVGHGRTDGRTRRPTQCREVESTVLPSYQAAPETSEEQGVAETPEQASTDAAEQHESTAEAQLPLPAPMPVEEAELIAEERIDEDLERVLRRLEEEGEQDGECRLWPQAGCNDQGYAVVSLGGRRSKRMVRVHKWLYERENGPTPRGWDIEHTCHTQAKARGECAGGKTCKHRRCCVLEHFEAMPHGENVQQRDEPTATNTTAKQFAIALFARYDLPAVEQKTINLEALVEMLTTFVEVKDKRRASCWSPTLYADGMTSRSNAGVEAVSALVFDLDKVPPDPERLAGMCWIAHTTWSHRPETPKWRVVIPLAAPVAASRWADVWRRARAALCPEADPSCKDPSRQYYVPSHAPGVTPEASHHDGSLLDPDTLPVLQPETNRPELQRSPTTLDPRAAMDADRRRGEVYMEKVIANLETTAPGGRNTALNAAAWTLGRWITAGAIEQGYAEDTLYSAAECIGLVADDGQRQCWATIRSGLSAGLLQPVDLNVDR